MAEPIDIAIIGMAGMFAKAADIDQFWSNILNKVDAISEATDAWLGEPKLFDPDARLEEMRIYTKKGGFLGDLSRFDPRPFGAMPVSVQGGEPDQFLALRCAQSALEDAGYSADKDFNRERAGCILGHAIHANRANINGFQHALMIDQLMSVVSSLHPNADDAALKGVEEALRRKLPKISVDTMPALVPNMMTGRICNRLDLMGPNYIMDAACASTPLAIDAAINELRNDRADVMLAGGVNTTTSTLVYSVFCQLGALSRREQVRPFSKDGDGTLLGEGQGIFVLKRLEDALSDGDHVHAVIKSVGASSDGRSSGLMAPRLEGEVLAICRAYELAEIDPATVDLIEAHGTGIPLGDETEITALHRVFGERRHGCPEIALGSVKSMIGHCIPAAGAASIIKMVMALKEKVLPPTLCDEVSGEIGIGTTPFYVNTVARPWIANPAQPRRAGVNAFGFGGVNSHVVLEQSPQTHDDVGGAFGVRRTAVAELFCFAAHSRKLLVERINGALSEIPEIDGGASLGCFADDINRRDKEGDYRFAVTANSWPDLRSRLFSALDKIQDSTVDQIALRSGVYFRSKPIDGKVAFLFPGEHSQYPEMLSNIAMNAPLVRRWLDRLEGLYGGARKISHRHLLFPPPTGLTEKERDDLVTRLDWVAEGSEAVFFADMAYFKLLTSLGVRADFMIGHSTGENAALVASGVVKLDDDDVCDYIRSMNVIFDEVEKDESVPHGALLNIGAASKDDFADALKKFADVKLTMDNCPNQKIIFGRKESISAVAEYLSSKGAICTNFPLSWAYHTEHIKPLADKFLSLFETIEIGGSNATLYSCSTASPYPNKPDAVRETAARQYMTRVRFTDAIERMYEDGARIFLEVGAENNLTGFVRDILGKKPHIAVSCDNRNRDSMSALLQMLGQLFVTGVFTAHKASPIRVAVNDVTTEPYLPSELPLIHLTPEEAEKARAALSSGSLQTAPPQPTVQTAAPRGSGPISAPSPQTAPSSVKPALQDWSKMFDVTGDTRIFAGRLATHGQLDAAIIAQCLSDAEKHHAAKAVFKQSVRRQTEWVLGRIAAKKAAISLLGAGAIDWRELSVLPDADGRPQLHATNINSANAIHLSITHKDGIAIGAASFARIGVDLEKSAGLFDPVGFSERVLTDDEQAYLDQNNNFERTATLFWSLKEATAKALGEPFVGQERAFVIENINPRTKQANVRFRGAATPVSYRFTHAYTAAVAKAEVKGIVR